jgi:Domain of Unknown Function (DUF928)
MKTIKPTPQLTVIIALLGLQLFNNLSVWAAPKPQKFKIPVQKIPKKWESRFKPPKGIGIPYGREGGATRGNPSNNPQYQSNCLLNGKKMTALLPPSSFGSTVSNTPTVFWYVPKHTAKAMRFIVQDKNENILYSKTFAVQGKNGIMKMQLPNAQSVKMKTGVQYNWYVELMCGIEDDPSDQSQFAHTGGAFKIVANQPIINKIKNQSSPDRFGVYTDGGYWYDTVNTLVQIRNQYPKDKQVQESWKKILESVGLQQLAKESIIDPLAISKK